MNVKRNLAAAAVLLASSAGLGGSACAMNPADGHGVTCIVEGADQLPPGIGGQQAVCAAIARSAGPALEQAGAANSALSVTVKVRSASRISAVATFNGKALSEQQVAISDRPLNMRAIEMLANAVARQISNYRQ